MAGLDSLLLVVLTAVHLGLAASSLKGPIEDARVGNAGAIIAWIDLPRMQSLLAVLVMRAN